MIDIGTKGFSF